MANILTAKLALSCTVCENTFTDCYRTIFQSGFSEIHKIGNISINANFVFPYICSFLLQKHHVMIINVELDVRLNFKVADCIGLVHL